MLVCMCVPGLMVVCMCTPGRTLVCVCIVGLMFVCIRILGLMVVCVCIVGLTFVCVCITGLTSVCMCDAVRRGKSQTARQQTTASAAPSPPGSPTPQWGSPLPPSPLETFRLPTSPSQPPLQIPPPPQLVSTLHTCLLQHWSRPHQCHTTGAHVKLCPYVHTFLLGGGGGADE